jgi:branched-chain amino acid transport system ATP-binding protein
MLDVQNVCIEFGGLKAVERVCLKVAQNELVGLIGPNGAGKTTLFNLITSIYKPTGGSISIDGKLTGDLRPFDVTNLCKAARTFQNIRLFKDLSVLDNVLVASHLKINYGLLSVLFRSQKFLDAEAAIKEQAMELLKIFGLDTKSEELAKNLPYGDQRRLEIVRALATQPKILFLDEPAAGMNESETLQLLELIKFVRDRFKVGILVIEHDMKFIMGLCERIYVLDHGQLIGSGTPAEIRQNPKVIRAYLGEDTEV